jgi:KaiC/GvpD/RAD55 family RecA-like ATPase
MKFIDVDMRVSHKDGDPCNYSPYNLELMSKVEYYAMNTSPADELRDHMAVDSIASIYKTGDLHMTYDLVMANPNRNYICNDMVVHNSGKSNFLYQSAAHLISIGHPVFIFSLEESAEVVTSLVYSHCMAQPCTMDHEAHFNHVVKVTSELLHVYDLRGQLTVDKMHEAVNYAVGRHNVKFVILDSIMMLKNCDIEDNKAMNDFMGDVQELVTSTRIHLLAVAHSRKGDYSSVSKIPGRDEIKGSGSIGAMAFNVFTIWRNLGKVKKLAEAMKSGDMENYYSIEKHFSDNIFNLCKQKVGGNLCMKDMFYNPANSRFRLRWQDQDEPYILSPSQLEAIELEKQIVANNEKLNQQQPF